MKTIDYDSNADSKSDEKTAIIWRKLEQLVCDYGYLVPDGWRFILKMQAAGDSVPYYHIDVQGDKGGGNYAEAKMLTLEQFPERAATGGDSIQELLEILHRYNYNGTDRYAQISKLQSTDLLNEDLHLWLRDEVGFTTYYGGIRIPYKDIIVEGGKITEEFGEIRIAFSGASAEQDLFFGLMVFGTLNDSFTGLYPNIQGWLDLRKLQKIPAIKFWLDILGIKGA
jgi:hypothetical protein